MTAKMSWNFWVEKAAESLLERNYKDITRYHDCTQRELFWNVSRNLPKRNRKTTKSQHNGFLGSLEALNEKQQLTYDDKKTSKTHSCRK